MPAQWPGSVSVTFEVDCGLEFLSVRSPSYVIYTGRFSAPIGRYPMHGQQPGRFRVSQQPLQGLRFAVSACLCCLGSTHLQPSNLLPYAGPVDGLPAVWPLGARRISADGVGTVICFLSVTMVLQLLLPGLTRPTWAYPARYRWLWLFRSSQCRAS
jgi:hypothetical protein